MAIKSDVNEMRGAGVELHACRHMMEAQKLNLGDLLLGFVVAERGAVVTLAELQGQGWAYLRPRDAVFQPPPLSHSPKTKIIVAFLAKPFISGELVSLPT
jgi:hypothetical protein